MTDQEDTPADKDSHFVTCRSFTAARRFPMVFGVIGGFVLPVPLSPAQAITFLTSFITLFLTRGLWGFLLPGTITFLVLVGVPIGLTWAVRHLRLEGRSPLKTAVGICTLWLAPPQGVLRGATARTPQPVRLRQKVLIVPTNPNPVDRLPKDEVEVPSRLGSTPNTSSIGSGWSGVS